MRFPANEFMLPSDVIEEPSSTTVLPFVFEATFNVPCVAILTTFEVVPSSSRPALLRLLPSVSASKSENDPYRTARSIWRNSLPELVSVTLPVVPSRALIEN